MIGKKVWQKAFIIVTSCCLLFSALLIDGGQRAEAAHSVVFDATDYFREWPRFERYINTSTRYAPPSALASKVENTYGKPKIARVWLTLDEMWDYRTDQYFYNYKIGYNRYVNDPNHYDYDWGTIVESDIYFYDYMLSFYDHSDDLLLNVRRYEADVINGTITWAKYKEVLKNGLRHYKQLYPNLKYIEALNEADVSIFGGLTDDQIYQFYQIFYQVVNELNAELDPDIPLVIGGTSSTWYARAIQFVNRYAADTNPDKKLGFISFHDYSGSEGNHKNFERFIDNTLYTLGLPTNIPVFVDELGYAAPTTNIADNLRNASRMARALYWSAGATNLSVFPWVTYHNPDYQLSLLQFHTEDLKTTPNAAMVEALRLHKKYQIWSENNVTGTFFSNATIDHTGVAVLATNQDAPATHNISVTLRNLPELFSGQSFTVKKYMIDSSHSNALTNTSYTGGLELVSTVTVNITGDLMLNQNVESNGIVFWLVEPVQAGSPLPAPPAYTRIEPLNYGVAATDTNTGLGYIMYSAQSVFTRFPNMYSGSSIHLVPVKYENGTWLYDNNTEWLPFTPVSSDLLIAEVDFDADTISLLEKQPNADGTKVLGIRSGVRKAYMKATPNLWQGNANPGEFTISGEGFVPCTTYQNSTVIDDAQTSQITYAGTWTTSSSDSNYYNLTKHVSNTVNSTATATFTGTGARIYIRQVSNAGMFDVYVNGAKQATLDAYSAVSHNQVMVWRISGLSPSSPTTIQIKLNGQKNSASPNYYIGLDFLEIDP